MNHAARPTRTNTWLRCAATAWAILIAVVASKALLKPKTHSVFPLYYEAASHAWHGTPYSQDPLLISAQYGPLFGQALAPLAAIPIGPAGCIWILVGVAVLLSGFLRFMSELSEKPPSDGLLALLLFLLPAIGFGSVYNLQVNVLLTGLLLWGVLLLRNSRWMSSAACLAAPACVKIYPHAFALLFIGLFPRRLAPRYIAAVLALLLAPFLFHPPDVVFDFYQDYVRYLASGYRQTHKGFHNYDFRTLWSHWVADMSLRQFALVQAAAGLAIFLACSRSAARVGDRDWTLLHTYRWASIYIVLFGPASEHHTYFLASPALLSMLAEAISNSRSVIRQASLWAACLFCGPIHTTLFGRGFHDFVAYHQLAPSGLLIAAAWLTWDSLVRKSFHARVAQESAPDARALDRLAA